MTHTYTIDGEWTPQQESEFLSDLDSWKGIRGITYNKFTYRLVSVDVDEFTAWRIELGKKLKGEN